MKPLDTASEPRPRLLSEQLENLRQTFAERRATLGEVIAALDGKAYTLLIIVFALPFAPPVTVPGASTPLGVIIAAIALQLAVGRLPWLPQRLIRWSLPPGFFTKLIPATARIVRSIERVVHPRWPQWTSTATVRGLHWVAIAAAALMLAVPIPVPFSNVVPGWTILLLAWGLLERDGICVVIGYVLFALTIVFFVAIAGATAEVATRFWDWVR